MEVVEASLAWKDALMKTGVWYGEYRLWYKSNSGHNTICLSGPEEP